MDEKRAYIYEVNFLAAEFGEVTVVVVAENQAEATAKISKWCDENYCVNYDSASGAGPKPILTQVAWRLI